MAFSYTTGNPNNLTAGATASMNDIQGPFTDIRTYLTGAGSTATLRGAYETLHDVSTSAGGGLATGTYYDTKSQLVPSGSGVGSAHRVVWLDPADHAVSGSTAKLRVRLHVMTNATAPTSTFSAALFNVAAATGAAGLTQITSLGSALGTTSTIVAPTASSGFKVDGSDIDVPTAGLYLLGLIIATSSTSANSVTNVTMTLHRHHV